MKIAELRKEFPLTEEVVYLNTAGEGPIPERGYRAMEEMALRKKAPHRISLKEHFDVPRKSRERCARLTGARPEEIALVPSTSYGINTAARGLGLGKGDRVIMVRGQFPCTVYPWMNLRAEGVDIDFVEYEEGAFPMERLEEEIGRGCSVVSISYIHFATGIKADIEETAKLCRKEGAVLIVDCTQGTGIIDENLPALGVDILACSGHKWLLSPVGTGFLYVNADIMDRLHPAFVGWLSFVRGGHFESLVDYDFTFPPDARRYETGSPPMHNLAAFNACLELFLETGTAEIQKHVFGLIDELAVFLEEQGAEIISPTEGVSRSGILSFKMKNSAELYRRLLAGKVICAFREGAVRISPHLFNNSDDIEIVKDIIDD